MTVASPPENSEVSGLPEPSAIATKVAIALRPLPAMLCGCLGGLAVWVIFLSCYPAFVVPDELSKMPPFPPREMVQRLVDAKNQTDFENRLLFFTLFGTLLAGALGMGEGIARRSLPGALLSAIGCAWPGAVFGGAAGMLAHLVFGRLPVPTASMSAAIEIHASLLAIIGSGVGLGLGACTKRLGAAAIGLVAGMLAGAVAGTLYPVISGLLLPTVHPEYILPDGAANQLLWIAVLATIIGPFVSGAIPTRSGRGRAFSVEGQRR